MGICCLCLIPACCWPVPSCWFTGVHEPTGACGRPKFPCTAFVGRSVGSGKRVPHAFRAAIPIAGSLTLPGRSALYPGGPLFGISADVCSKTLLWVMTFTKTGTFLYVDVGDAVL